MQAAVLAGILFMGSTMRSYIPVWQQPPVSDQSTLEKHPSWRINLPPGGGLITLKQPPHGRESALVSTG